MCARECVVVESSNTREEESANTSFNCTDTNSAQKRSVTHMISCVLCKRVRKLRSHMYVCTRAHTHTHSHTHTHTHTHTLNNTHTHTYIHTHTHTHIHTQTHTYRHIYTYTHTDTQSHSHTHTHTHTICTHAYTDTPKGTHAYTHKLTRTSRRGITIGPQAIPEGQFFLLLFFLQNGVRLYNGNKRMSASLSSAHRRGG